MANSRWQDIYLYLKNNDIDVYSPGQHQGDCLSNYVVIKEGTSIQLQTFSSSIDEYILMCYVPYSKYSELKPFVDKIIELMKGMQPMIMPLYQRDIPFFDEDVKANMVSIHYRNCVKN